MLKRAICAVTWVVLLTATGSIQAATFELLPTYDTYVSNDAGEGPTTNHEGGSGMHARDVGGRRRVGYVTYDLSEAKALGAFFANVGFSNYGHDGGTIDVYGVLEAQESLVTEGLTWSNAPGVKNNPLPPVDDAVALDAADLTGILLTFDAPARGVRESTETSEALAEFLNSDTNGFVALMFAPASGGNAILRTVEMGAEGGTLLAGEVGGQATAAQNPLPQEEAVDVSREAVLSWTPGGHAAAHDVYLGTVFEDVNTASRANPMGVLVGQGQDAVTYDPGRLELGQTYYWRIDEVNAPPDATIFKGEVWSFTAEPLAYVIENIAVTSNAATGPAGGLESTVNGAGLDDDDQHSTLATDMWLGVPSGAEPVWIEYEFDRVYKLHELWVWNYNVLFEAALGFGLRDVTIEYSTDKVDWTTLGDFEFAQATALEGYAHNTTVDLGGVAGRYVRLTVRSGWGVLGQFGLSEVRFLQIPAFAREPQPASGATELSPNATLSWRAGREAASHEVYLGTDPETLAQISIVTENSVAPSDLEFGRTYYWRVDEVNEAEAVGLWEGGLWDFATQEYATIDGFEDYTDNLEAGEAIFQTWIDGWENETGSVVGHLDAPFAEQTIVRSGRQSMPLEYNNTAAPFYSEAERDLGVQDWTVNGADTLVVHFQGRPEQPEGNQPDTLYVAVEDTSGRVQAVSHPSGEAAVLLAGWNPWLIPLSEFSAAGVALDSVKKMYIGVGDRDNPQAGGSGLIYIDDIQFGRPAATE